MSMFTDRRYKLISPDGETVKSGVRLNEANTYQIIHPEWRKEIE